MKNEKVPAMNTMVDCVNNLTIKGYTETFQVRKGRLRALSDESHYAATQVAITNFYRFEGQNDPSDSAIVYVIETNNGKKGMLIDAFGVNADSAISSFILQVETIQKKAKSQ